MALAIGIMRQARVAPCWLASVPQRPSFDREDPARVRLQIGRFHRRGLLR